MATARISIRKMALIALLLCPTWLAAEARAAPEGWLRNCPLVNRQLVVLAPRVHQAAAFRWLGQGRAVPLSDAQAGELLGYPRRRDGTLVGRFLTTTIRVQTRQREQEMDEHAAPDDPPTWMSPQEEDLLALEQLRALGPRSNLRPYLVMAKATPDTDSYQIEDCGGILQIEAFGMDWAHARDVPLLVFLDHPLKDVRNLGAPVNRTP